MRTERRSRKARRHVRRDRRGRGLRGPLAPATVPVSRTRGDEFDALVVDAVAELDAHWASELADVEFIVEDVPPEGDESAGGFDPEVVADRGVALGRLHRNGTAGVPGPAIVVYRRPIETRADERDDRADIVFTVVAELAAELLGRDISEIE